MKFAIMHGCIPVIVQVRVRFRPAHPYYLNIRGSSLRKKLPE